MDLLPCPFCGGKPKLERIGNAYTKSIGVRIRCDVCRFEQQNNAKLHSFEWLEEKTKEWWNGRNGAG